MDKGRGKEDTCSSSSAIYFVAVGAMPVLQLLLPLLQQL
jgi:hypothetical protein